MNKRTLFKYVRRYLTLCVAVVTINSTWASASTPRDENNSAKCLTYGNRIEVQGLLNNYPAGRGWILKNPIPNCIAEDPSNKRFRPGRADLSTTMLVLAPREIAKYKNYAGEQVTVSGLLTFVVDGDVSYFQITDIRVRNKLDSK
jgi:hypothetical protein